MYDLIHARAEFRAVGILSDEIADEAIDLFVQLRPFFIINGDKARGPFLCHWCYRLRRGQDQAFFLHLSRTRPHIWSPSRHSPPTRRPPPHDPTTPLSSPPPPPSRPAPPPPP